MLVAERNLQVENVFTITLKAEMARLDDTGMNRPDRDFMDFLTVNSVEVGDANRGRLARLPAPRVVTGTVGRMKTKRLKPRMPLGAHAVLFGDFPLEQVNLGTIRGEGGKAIRIERGLADVQK